MNKIMTFSYFPKFKIFLKGPHFQTLNDVKNVVLTWSDTQDHQFSRVCVNDCHHRLNYFEVIYVCI